MWFFIQLFLQSIFLFLLIRTNTSAEWMFAVIWQFAERKTYLYQSFFYPRCRSGLCDSGVVLGQSPAARWRPTTRPPLHRSPTLWPRSCSHHPPTPCCAGGRRRTTAWLQPAWPALKWLCSLWFGLVLPGLVWAAVICPSGVFGAVLPQYLYPLLQIPHLNWKEGS